MVNRLMCIHLTVTSVLSTAVPGCTAFTPTGDWLFKNTKHWKELQHKRKYCRYWLRKTSLRFSWCQLTKMQVLCSLNFKKGIVYLHLHYEATPITGPGARGKGMGSPGQGTHSPFPSSLSSPRAGCTLTPLPPSLPWKESQTPVKTFPTYVVGS